MPGLWLTTHCPSKLKILHWFLTSVFSQSRPHFLPKSVVIVTDWHQFRSNEMFIYNGKSHGWLLALWHIMTARSDTARCQVFAVHASRPSNRRFAERAERDGARFRLLHLSRQIRMCTNHVTWQYHLLGNYTAILWCLLVLFTITYTTFSSSERFKSATLHVQVVLSR